MVAPALSNYLPFDGLSHLWGVLRWLAAPSSENNRNFSDPRRVLETNDDSPVQNSPSGLIPPADFTTFMRAYQDMVFSTAARLTGNEAQAEDISQEVFLKAHAHFDNLRTSPTAGGWLKTVATNLSLNSSTVPVQVANVSSALLITSQGYHSMAVLTNGSVLSWGANFSGDFGTGTAATQTSPVAIPSLSNIKSVSGGGFFSLLVKNDGTVWSWGNNPDGELGNGTTTSTNVPTQIGALSTVAQAAAGGFHGVALKTNGTVWTWGYNGYCELGNGTQINSLSPVQVSNLAGVTAVAAGQVHTLALKGDGTVWAWGYNGDGELGNGTSNNLFATPTQVSGLSGVVAICAGYFHSMALKSDGSVWSGARTPLVNWATVPPWQVACRSKSPV